MGSEEEPGSECRSEKRKAKWRLANILNSLIGLNQESAGGNFASLRYQSLAATISFAASGWKRTLLAIAVFHQTILDLFPGNRLNGLPL